MKTFILSAILVITLSAKDRNWQMGKVTDEATTTNTYAGQAPRQTVVIACAGYTYTAELILRWRWSKDANLTVNTPVKFAVERRKLFLVDDSGKQYELNIVKRVKN